MNEATLIEKLLKIEALFSGAATEGERASAGLARQRILQRLAELIPEDPPVEYKSRTQSWSSDLWKLKCTLIRDRLQENRKPLRAGNQRQPLIRLPVGKIKKLRNAKKRKNGDVSHIAMKSCARNRMIFGKT